MRNYEVAYIVDPDVDEEALEELEGTVTGWIDAAGGKIGEIDRWGKRRLAYPINKKNEGYYIFIQSEMPTDAPIAVERDLSLSEEIMRFMVTLQETT
jgi:small subunit ribosomal protein S6